MLDRLISGAGALTDRADRLVRAITSGRGPDVMGNRPGSVFVIVLLIVASVAFGLLALESTDNPTPREIAPAEVASADDIGRRVYATIEGVVADSFVETFPDDDADGIQDADETGDAWYYLLIDESGSGVTVRSTRHPEDIYRYTATGVVVRDPQYVSVDVAQFGQLEGTSGIELDDTFYLDASSVPSGSPQPLDLSGRMPAPGTAVTITGPYIGWLDVCLRGRGWRRRVRGVRVRRHRCVHWRPGQRPGDHGPAGRPARAGANPVHRDVARRGLLDPRRQVDARSRLRLTRHHHLRPLPPGRPGGSASAGLSLGLAILAGLAAAILAVGLVGGYLVFRRSKRPLPSGGRTMGPGDEIPIHVTGALRREDGLIHVREARARLLRFPLEVPAEPVAETEPEATAAVEMEPPPEPEATMTEPEAPPAEPEAPVAWESACDPGHSELVVAALSPPQAAESSPGRRCSRIVDVPTTLILEPARQARGGRAREGRAPEQLVSGRVMPFRGPRPALQ